MTDKCSCSSQLSRTKLPRFITTQTQTLVGQIPLVKTKLNLVDHLGAIGVRLGINRMGYRVMPGLYAVGNPDEKSPVFVSANYKLSFDILREQLNGIDSWILVLETYGVNVWCAAGKGNFSAQEIAIRIKKTNLGSIVSHRTIIVPQLGAVGVAAHEVKKLADFKVVYGPIRARDIKAFMESGMKATADMRRMSFPFIERLKLVPLELRYAMKFAIPLLAILGVIFGISKIFFDIQNPMWTIFGIFISFLIGSVFVPSYLPWIPFRSFVIKGASVGFIWAMFVSAVHNHGWISILGNLLLIPAIAAFFALNFTGSTTYTSQSGVNKEIGRYARPMGISAICGLVLTIVSLFF